MDPSTASTEPRSRGASTDADERVSSSASAVPDSPLLEATTRLEQDERLDVLTAVVARPARLLGGPLARRFLGGQWLGHALHPLLTDLPLGCWIGAGLLDVLSPRRDRNAAQRLVGLGVLCAVPTAASGLSDWSSINDREPRRVGGLHAVLNGFALGSYLWSWSLRRRRHHGVGVAISLVGASAAWVAGYLGGHMTLNQHLGGGAQPRHAEPGLG
jgi:Predicted membrane protein (DUF2231)